MIFLFFVCRNGGCHGEGDIRKLAYFESSIDPETLAGRVSLECSFFVDTIINEDSFYPALQATNCHLLCCITSCPISFLNVTFPNAFYLLVLIYLQRNQTRVVKYRCPPNSAVQVRAYRFHYLILQPWINRMP